MPPDTDSEIDLLDFLLDLSLVVVENIRLLLLVPVIFGALMYGLSNVLPKTYESRVILKGTAQTVSLLNTAQVVDPVIEKLQLIEEDESIEETRERMQKKVKASYNAKDMLVTITAQARTPQAAQTLAQAMTQSLFVSSQPRGAERERLEALLKATEARLSEAGQTDKQIRQHIMRSDAKGGMDMAQGYATLIDAISALEKKQQDIFKELQGLGESSLLQPATLERIPVRPRPASLIAWAVIGSALGLLFFVFMRHWLRQGAQNEETAAKLEALRRSARRVLGR